MLGILHFPRVLPLSLHGRTFCLHTDSMVVYFVCEGWVLSFPSLERGFWFCFVFNRTFPLFLSTSQASWMWLQIRVSRQGPTSTEWMLEPGSFESFCQELSIFPTVALFLLEGHLQALLFCFSMPGSTVLFYQNAWDPFFRLKNFSLQFMPSLLRDSCLFLSRELFGSGEPCFWLCLWIRTVHGFWSWPFPEDHFLLVSWLLALLAERDGRFSRKESFRLRFQNIFSLPVCAFRDSCQADPGISSSAFLFTFCPVYFGS